MCSTITSIAATTTSPYLPPEFALRRARLWLRGGALIAYPTEALYGLGCDPRQPAALQRLLALKQRPIGKGLILIAADFSQLRPYLSIDEAALPLSVRQSWPGPHSWLLPARPSVSRWLRGDHATLAVRITAHPIAAALCRAYGGAIVSTSANPTGRPPARTPLAVRRYFPTAPLQLLYGATGGAERPSTLRDAASGAILRG